MLKHQIEERRRERRRPVAPPSSSHRRRYSARYGLTDPSDLDVYFVGASGIHPSRLRTSSDSSLGGLVTVSGGLANALGGLVTTSGGLANALGGLAPTSNNVFFSWGGGGSSACAQNDGQQVLRAASKRFLTEDEARQEQGKQTQGVVSAVKRSATRERVRPPRNSTRAARDTRAAPQRTQFHQSIAQELRKKIG